MTSFDLKSAFLQIPLQARSRKYTASLFDTNVYQFQRVPFGKKNTLATFVGGLRKVLESDVSSFCSCYVDEIRGSYRKSSATFFFACELGTADEGECGGRWNQLLCYP